MNIIVAIDAKNGIGKDGGLLCHIPSDLKYFKQMTSGKTVIMGRKTLISLPRSSPLPNRRNIILSSTLSGVDGAEVCSSPELLDSMLSDEEKETCFIIGGASVYAGFLHSADTLYITHILADLSADVFFPEISEDEFRETSRSQVITENGINFYWSVYKRITE